MQCEVRREGRKAREGTGEQRERAFDGRTNCWSCLVTPEAAMPRISWGPGWVTEDISDFSRVGLRKSKDSQFYNFHH